MRWRELSCSGEMKFWELSYSGKMKFWGEIRLTWIASVDRWIIFHVD